MEALKFCHRFASYELILIGLPLPLMHKLIISLLGIGSYSGTELVEPTLGGFISYI